MIIIITPLSFIPAMNIYETALLYEPNWKSIYVARTEETKEAEGEWGEKVMTVVLLWSPYFYSVFIIFHATVKCKPI